MHVVATVPLYPPGSLVGAWIATHEHLRHLVNLGHQVTVVPYLSRQPHYVHDGVHVLNRDATPDGDLVVAHAGDNGSGAALADRLQVPLVYLAHGEIADPAKLDGADLVVFNSHTLRDSVNWDGPSIIAHPPVRPETYRTTPGCRVTLVNLTGAKGADLFWLLAAAEPAREFMAVRGGYGKQILRSAPNVSVLRRPTLNMRDDVYAHTRVLLMPSEKETWGRVAMEAACSGIPTIAHPTPGLVESLGPAGIFVERTDLDGWRRALARLDDPCEYAAASMAARGRANLLEPEADLARFASAVEALCR